MATEAAQASALQPVGERNLVHWYEEWEQREGVPIVTGFYIEDLGTLELGDWARRGGKGALVNLEGTGGLNDMHVVEIAPGGQLAPIRHMFDAMYYVVSGRGSASVWYEGGSKQTFEWGTGSLFAIPINASYQLFNGSGSEPARLAAVTNAPLIMNLFHNEEFIFNNPFLFKDRYAGENDYFSNPGTLYRQKRVHLLETNFVPDVRTMQLYEWRERGEGSKNVQMNLADGSMGAHVSQFPIGTYKKGHRHGPGAHVVILYGEGYSLLWQAGDTERIRCDWKPNTVVVPPANWYHQHFNTGPNAASYLALKLAGRRYFIAEEFTGDRVDQSVAEGGWQIEHADEDPTIHREYEAELASHSAQCYMKGMVPWCTSSKGLSEAPAK